jgi:hypothetical protein
MGKFRFALFSTLLNAVCVHHLRLTVKLMLKIILFPFLLTHMTRFESKTVFVLHLMTTVSQAKHAIYESMNKTTGF